MTQEKKEYRLWTIADAKDGDVLIDKSNGKECPFIFKETKPSNIKTDVLNPLSVLGYCGIGGAGFTKGNGWGDTANCTYYPANKEQQNLLFQKMKEAGYEWDAEKKELNKVEQKDVIHKELTEFEKAVKQVMEEAIECGDTHNLKADAEMLYNLARKPVDVETSPTLEEHHELDRRIMDAFRHSLEEFFSDHPEFLPKRKLHWRFPPPM